jgi:hypothetical protein
VLTHAPAKRALWRPSGAASDAAGGDAGAAGVGDGEGGVLPGEPEIRDAPADRDLAPRDPFGFDRGDGPPPELLEPVRHPWLDIGQGLEHLPLLEALHDGRGQPLGAQQARARGNEHGLDPQALGHRAGVLRPGPAEGDEGVLRPGPAEGDEGVLRGVVSPTERHRTNGIGHALVGDVQEPLEQRVRIRSLARLLMQVLAGGLEGLARAAGVDREHESLRGQAPQKQVHVGDRERSSRAVAGGAGVRPGAPGPDVEASRGEAADGAAPRGHALDGEGGCEEVRIPDVMLELVLVVAVEAGDVGAGPAHVEGEDPGEARAPGGGGRPDDASGGPAQEAVLGAEGAGPVESARARHRVERPVRDAPAHALEVVADHGGEIRIHHGGLRSRQDLDARRQLARHRDVLEAVLEQNVPESLLVPWVSVGVQQRDRGDAQAPLPQALEIRPQRVDAELLEDRAVGPDALGDLDGCWVPMSRASPNPRVVKKATRAPWRSSSAFVPRVVPRRMVRGGSAVPAGVRVTSRAARTGASSGERTSKADPGSRFTGIGSASSRVVSFGSNLATSRSRPGSPSGRKRKPLTKSSGAGQATLTRSRRASS